ncbi:hypothetical protein BpHYR1_042900 [Brachionus plicatilis]|uniref:Uncharacterized protein n=1 Tax=Brachionus plicatilis TaxID=10195 RepID=A0A3M7SGW8_BRAPC|nr:hypothetical protein BpHYR1_042900 [Brachionus plicatilis]
MFLLPFHIVFVVAKCSCYRSSFFSVDDYLKEKKQRLFLGLLAERSFSVKYFFNCYKVELNRPINLKEVEQKMRENLRNLLYLPNFHL